MSPNQILNKIMEFIQENLLGYTTTGLCLIETYISSPNEIVNKIMEFIDEHFLVYAIIRFCLIET